MGAGGFVGAAIVRNLRRRGVETLSVTRGDVDLLQADAAEKLAELLQPTDGVAAVSALAPVKNLSMLRDNLVMIETIAEALRKRPVAHVLNIGSDAVFADSPEPLNERSARAPESLHGIMHLTRELVLGEAAGEVPFATLRPTLIYGADDPHNGYGPNRFRRLAAEGKTIVLFGHGEERRDHVWVEDVGELAVRMLLRRSRGSLNAATGSVISFKEIAEAICAQMPTPSNIETTPRQSPMTHNGYRPFDPTATRAAFPDFAYTLPRDGFAKVHAAIREAA
jgi:nucleoside-diphosphate-sugar epimerase